MRLRDLIEAKHPADYRNRIPVSNTEDADEIARQALGPLGDTAVGFDIVYDYPDGVYLDILSDNGRGR